VLLTFSKNVSVGETDAKFEAVLLTYFNKFPMKHYCEQWIHDWCQLNGWTELYIERSQYWAFPPGAVMPEPIPPKVLRLIKAEKGLSPSEKWWSISAVILTLIAAISSYLLKCPMPIVFAFAFGAITVALMEIEEN
jgi:hypothetical protein